jgi:hypothetical protein
MGLVDVERLAQIAGVEFSDIVEDTVSGLNRLRIILKEGSFIDIWYSVTNSGRYAYHWERRVIDGTVYRHDNAPHRDWIGVSTFPEHFHDRQENRVEVSEIPDDPQEATRYFLRFVRDKVTKKQ